MAALKQHTVIVTSNVDDARNTSSHFYNTMGKSMDLSQGHWKVAIKKIIYLNSFLNIIDETIGVTKREVMEIKKVKPDDLPRYNHRYPGDAKYPRSDVINIEWVYDMAHNRVITVSLHKDAKISNVFCEAKAAKRDDVKDENGKIVGKSDYIWYGSKKAELVPPPPSFLSFLADNDLDAPAELVSIKCEWDETITFPLPQGNYETTTDLITALNNTTKTKGVEFSLENNFIKVAIDQKLAKAVYLNNDLNLTLGFNEVKLTKSTKATHLPQLNRGRFAFFIYSNLVHNVRVGNMEAPLMDVVSIPKQEFADIVSLDVVNPLYSDVSLKQVHEIEIMLASDSGELIKFDNAVGNAKTLLVLHFIQTI